MTRKDKISDERIPKFLQDLKEQNPFIIPPNYFEDLPDQIMQRIHQEAEPKVKPSVFEIFWNTLNPFFAPKPVWALALVVVIAGIFLLNVEKTDDLLALEEVVSTEEISHYVQLHLDEFEEQDFYSSEVVEIDMLGESLEQQESDPLLDGLFDDIDLETIQRIL